MTQKELFELIKQHHPNMGNVEIRARLNRTQNDFCARTELMHKTYRQLTDPGKRYYSLDTDILKIIKVQLDDILIPRLIGDPIIDDDEWDGDTGRSDADTGSTDWYWYISNDRIGIVEKGSITVSNKTANYKSISTEKELRLFTISQATDFGDDLTQQSDLPVQFREGLSFKVIADGYLKGEALNPDLAKLFLQRYDIAIKEGKKYARSNRTYNAIIRPQDF